MVIRWSDDNFSNLDLIEKGINSQSFKFLGNTLPDLGLIRVWSKSKLAILTKFEILAV
jgi:hypothetical protein